jgi:hypothetical protein
LKERKTVNVKNLSIAFSVILLSGCSLFGREPVQPIQVETKFVERTRLELREPEPLKLSKITWFVITPENIVDVFEELKYNNYDLVLFGLPDDGYENLSMNMAELRKYIIQQKSIIAAYKDYYEPEPEP